MKKDTEKDVEFDNMTANCKDKLTTFMRSTVARSTGTLVDSLLDNLVASVTKLVDAADNKKGKDTLTALKGDFFKKPEDKKDDKKVEKKAAPKTKRRLQKPNPPAPAPAPKAVTEIDATKAKPTLTALAKLEAGANQKEVAVAGFAKLLTVAASTLIAVFFM